MGEKALDRSDKIKRRYPPTTSAALTESKARAGTDLCAAFTAPAFVSPLKYRSEKRKDQLHADMRLLIVAGILFVDHSNDTLEKWNWFLLPQFDVPVWDFPTAKIETPIQQALPP